MSNTPSPRRKHCAVRIIVIYKDAIHALGTQTHSRGLSVSILSKTIPRVFVYYIHIGIHYIVYTCIINVRTSVWTYMGFRRHYQKHITLSFLTHARADAARGLTCSIPSDSRDLFSFLYNKRFFSIFSRFLEKRIIIR